MIRIENIKIYENYEEAELKDVICKKYKIKEEEAQEFYIYKKSVDARDKENVHFCISVNMKLKDERRFKKYIVKEEETNSMPLMNIKKPEYKIVIIGSGPAGLFAALELIKYRYSANNNRARKLR